MLRAVIDEVGTDGLGDFRTDLPSDSYATLIRAIAGQQLSNAAAAAIYRRLLERYGGRPPAPAEILAEDPEDLRVAAGLSHAKVRYLRSLAEHVLDGSLDLDRLSDLPDEEVIRELVAVKGIGLWSAQMFLIIHLGRPDVLPMRRPRDPQGGHEPVRTAVAAELTEPSGAVAPVSDARSLCLVRRLACRSGPERARRFAPAGDDRPHSRRDAAPGRAVRLRGTSRRNGGT